MTNANKPSNNSGNGSDNKQTIVVVASVCTLITTIIGMVTFGIKFNDRIYASKDDVAKLELQLRTVDTKLNWLLGSSSSASSASSTRRQIPR